MFVTAVAITAATPLADYDSYEINADCSSGAWVYFRVTDVDSNYQYATINWDNDIGPDIDTTYCPLGCDLTTSNPRDDFYFWPIVSQTNATVVVFNAQCNGSEEPTEEDDALGNREQTVPAVGGD
jgi:hypothetical protein